MAREFLTDDAKQALTGAIQEVEAVSSAEVVIAVRARSATYLHGPVVFGVVAGFATSAFLLYSDLAFSLSSILVDPFILGVLATAVGVWVPALQRGLTPATLRRQGVQTAAQATFVARGIHRTRDHTGILVYISRTERMVEVLADSGIERAVPARDWGRAVAHIDQAVGNGGDGAAVAEALTRMAEVLAPVLPRSDDDVNELPDEVFAS